MARTYIGALRGSMSMNTGEWQRNFKRAEGSVNDFRKSVDEKAKRIERAGRRMETFGRSMMKFSGMIAGAIGGTIALAHQTAKYAVEVDNISRRTRFATDTTQQWMFVTDQLNTTMSVIERTSNAFISRISQIESGTGEASNAFRALGVQLRDNEGNLRRNEDLYFDIVRALSSVENETQRNIYANALFGRSFAELNNIFDAGSDKIDQLMNRSRELGLVMSKENIESAKEFSDMMGELKMQFTALSRELGMELIPILKQDFIPFVQDSVIPAMREKVVQMRNIIQAYRDLPEPIKAATHYLTGFFLLLAPVAFAAGKVTKIVSGLYKVIGAGVAVVGGTASSVISLAAGLGILAVAEHKHIKNLGQITDAHNRLSKATAAQDLEGLQSLYSDLTAQYNENAIVLQRLEDNVQGAGKETAELRVRMRALRDTQADLLEQLSLVSKTMRFVSAQKIQDAVATEQQTLAVQGYTQSLTELKPVQEMVIDRTLQLSEAQTDYNKTLDTYIALSRELPEIHSIWGENLDRMKERYTDLGRAIHSFAEEAFHSSVVAGKGIDALRNNIIDSARRIIAARMWEAVAHYLASLFASLGPFALVAASGGASAVVSLFNSIIPSFAQEGIAFGPTLAMIGDRPGSKGEVVMGLERYEAMIRSSHKDRIDVNVGGIMFGNDFRLMEKRNERRSLKIS